MVLPAGSRAFGQAPPLSHSSVFRSRPGASCELCSQLQQRLAVSCSAVCATQAFSEPPPGFFVSSTSHLCTICNLSLKTHTFIQCSLNLSTVQTCHNLKPTQPGEAWSLAKPHNASRQRQGSVLKFFNKVSFKPNLVFVYESILKFCQLSFCHLFLNDLFVSSVSQKTCHQKLKIKKTVNQSLSWSSLSDRKATVSPRSPFLAGPCPLPKLLPHS